MLRRWMVLPLKELEPIRERHEIVAHFLADTEFRQIVSLHLREIGDLERIVSKVATTRINPKEIVQLKRALTAILPIKEACTAAPPKALAQLGKQLNLCADLRERIARELLEDPAISVGKGEVIAPGINAELDELRTILKTGKGFLDDLREREIARTGI